jgi:hypothetical protein
MRPFEGRLKACLGLLPWLLLLALGGCDAPRDAEPVPPAEAGYRGVFILNEGEFGKNAATLSYYDPDSNYAHQSGVFRAVNDEELGDVGNDAVVDQDTLFLVINGSRLIYKLQLPSLELLGRLHLPEGASPRQLLRLGPNKAYVTSLTNGKLYVVDPVTMEQTGTIDVQNYMEGLARAAGKLFVACGNYTGGQTNNKVAVIDPATDAVQRYIELPITNPGSVARTPGGRILVNARGQYYTDEQGAICLIDPGAARLDTAITLPAKTFGAQTIAQGGLYFLLGSETGQDQSVARLDLATYAVDSSYLSRQALGLGPQTTPYALAYDEREEALYITAYKGPINGRCLVYGLDGTRRRTMPAGVFPGEVFFYR